MADLDFTRRENPTRKPGWLRKTFGVAMVGLGVVSLMALDQTDIVINASKSLDERAFLIWEKPVFLNRGTVIAADMPDVLKPNFDGMMYIKRIGGLPGDEISFNANNDPCIDNMCYPLMVSDEKVLKAIRKGVIPEDHYAVFGTSENSLDSRYEAIGFVPASAILGRGWAIPWPQDWRDAAQ